MRKILALLLALLLVFCMLGMFKGRRDLFLG